MCRTSTRWIPWQRVGLALLAAAVVACGPSGAATPAAPASGTSSDAARVPAGWEDTIASAKREGRLTLSAPASDLWREQLTAFQKEYPEIQVEYTGGNSRDFWPRLTQERQADQYLWDVRIGGPDPQVYAAKNEGVLAPAREIVALPEVLDDSKWFGGYDSIYADKERRFIVGFQATTAAPAYVNRDLVPEAELRSERDLLDPKWRGKIVIQDPRGGAGLAVLATLLQVHGEQFVRDLLRQELVVTGDNRQLVEWIVRGRYPIAIGLRSYDLRVFQQEGLGKSVQPVRGEAILLSIGSGGIQVITRAPHPKATQLFVNWLMTQRVQESLSEATGDNSRRTDVPVATPEDVPDRNQMEKYVPHQDEELLPVRVRALQLAEDLLK